MGLFVLGRRKLAFGERKQKATGERSESGPLAWGMTLPPQGCWSAQRDKIPYRELLVLWKGNRDEISPLNKPG
jgi:hypothetical protein